MDDTVDIEHRYNLNDQVVQVLALAGIGVECNEIVDDPFYHITGGGFAGMLPPKHPDHIAVFNMLLACAKCDDGDRIPANSFSHTFDGYEIG
jgi:hypothetical protein